MNIQFSQQKLENICRENNINFLGLFGSYARNEAKEDSDIDLLVDFNETKSLFELARIKFSLEDILNNEVDLVLRKSIKEKINGDSGLKARVLLPQSHTFFIHSDL